ncbi:MAG: 50S ribosomal protein L11 [Parcubacteria group bacterium ADurb.Bin159]|jgi:large subunit ribosomal protein L11|nr:MAG: 50S ribosomal protein L11 [Parcubacteria group bacterium ADurb.Bin159]
MAVKKVKAIIRLQIPAGGATPAPPVGPALGQHGLNISEFCNKFNNQTQDKKGNILTVQIMVYEDRTYSFVVKTPLTADLLRKAAQIDKGASNTLTGKKGKITQEQLKEIALIKMPDLNTTDINEAVKIIAGTAHQMGIDII